jgi:hypothetical protein
LGLVTAPLPAPLLHGRRWLRRGTCPGGRTVATGC